MAQRKLKEVTSREEIGLSQLMTCCIFQTNKEKIHQKSWGTIWEVKRIKKVRIVTVINLIENTPNQLLSWKKSTSLWNFKQINIQCSKSKLNITNIYKDSLLGQHRSPKFKKLMVTSIKLEKSWGEWEMMKSIVWISKWGSGSNDLTQILIRKSKLSFEKNNWNQ